MISFTPISGRNKLIKRKKKKNKLKRRGEGDKIHVRLGKLVFLVIVAF